MRLLVRQQVDMDELAQVDRVKDEACEPAVVPDQLCEELHDLRSEGAVDLAVEDHRGEHLVDHAEVLWSEEVRPVERRDAASLCHDADDGDASELPW